MPQQSEGVMSGHENFNMVVPFIVCLHRFTLCAKVTIKPLQKLNELPNFSLGYFSMHLFFFTIQCF